jgi:hypothetical protein
MFEEPPLSIRATSSLLAEANSAVGLSMMGISFCGASSPVSPQAQRRRLQINKLADEEILMLLMADWVLAFAIATTTVWLSVVVCVSVLVSESEKVWG